MRNALKAYSRAFAFLGQHGLTKLLWFPAIITLLVLFGGFSLTSYFTEFITDWLNAWIDSVELFSGWGEYLAEVLYWIIWLALRIALYFLMAFVGGSIILLLMSPILTYCSEQVAKALGSDVPKFTLGQFIRDLSRAVGLAITNGAIQIGLTLVCFIIGFIPIIGFASPFLMLLVNAYFFGSNFMDYSLERKGISTSESRSFVWQNRSKSTTLGMPFALWMLIPFIGPMTAGFAALFATVASTIVLEEGLIERE